MEYSVTVAILILLLVAVLRNNAKGYVICGDGVDEDLIAKGKAETIKRILKIRRSDGGWENTAITSTILHLTAPENVTEIYKTVAIVKNNVKKNFKRMTIRELSESAVFLQVACDNNRDVYGIDLLKIIDYRLRKQFTKKSNVPKDGFMEYSIGLGSLCVSQYDIRPTIINELLRNQNPDGSFGERKSIDDTSFMAPTMFRLLMMSSPKFNQRLTELAAVRLKEFLISTTILDKNGKYQIGNSNSWPMALLYLSKIKLSCESSDRWSCLHIMKNYGIYPKLSDKEKDLTTRLLLFDGTTYANIMNPTWRCVDEKRQQNGIASKDSLRWVYN